MISLKYIQKLKKIITKNFNVLLVGNTNVGKSTLINEFLKLEEGKKAKESDGGPTDTIDFTPYKGENNNNVYNLYDTNGITNDGKDCIENKIANTIKEIDLRISSENPNKLIHCIWYCMTGSNIQPSDGKFIKELLNIYTTYSIPIIFVHTQTYSKKQSETCKKGMEKYLKEIYKDDNSKVEELLKNYINIMAKRDEDEEKEAFGLDKLESITKKQIEEKGFKSSYYELIKKDIYPILINSAFNIIFTEYNLKKLQNSALKSLSNYNETLIKLLNDKKLELNNEIINKNKISIDLIYKSFENIENDLKENLKNLLTMKELKKNNEEFIKKFYDLKNEDFKKKNNFSDFNKNVENLIYDNISNRTKELINNILNQGFTYYIINIMKEIIKRDRKSTRLNSSHTAESRMPSSA